jgi:hypothetical protein
MSIHGRPSIILGGRAVVSSIHQYTEEALRKYPTTYTQVSVYRSKGFIGMQ